MFGTSLGKTCARTAACLALALTTGTAAWSSPVDGNDFLLLDNGQNNRLNIITPAADASGADTAASGNRLNVTIEGDGNGGWGQRWQTPLFSRGFAAPGLLQQTGFDNVMSLDVSGQDNIFSIYQSGSGNSATGLIKGFSNAASVVQQGNGNMAVFSQSGSGNALAISQNSW